MPTEVIATIDELFPHARNAVGNGILQASHSSQLLCIFNLVRAVPDELIDLSPADYAELVLATSTIEAQLGVWALRGDTAGRMGNVKGRDAVTALRRVLAECPDENP